MGGAGSGRYWQSGADTTDEYRSIDIRWLKREGFLSSGMTRRITWYRNGVETGSINIQVGQGHVILEYRYRGSSKDWQAQRYPVYLDTTPCHMGGVRHWFLCPVRGCNKRVAILYGGEIFACRHCHKLVYGSQREQPAFRALRRAYRIRDTMGWTGGVADGCMGKPKGMHWRTYERLCRKHDALSTQATNAMARHLGLLNP